MNKNLVLPDYNNSIMNISTSILKHYNVKTKFSTIDILDKELEKNYRNVVVILVDALGHEILKKHIKESKYLRENQVKTLTSVFPSTTTSATTSIITAKPPINTGWIGWLQYIKEEDKSIIFFLNKDFYNNNYEFNYNISEKYAPVTKIYDLIEKANKDVFAREIFPEFKEPNNKSFKDICNAIKKETEKEGKHFIYAYWDKFDTYLHKYGTQNKIVKDHLKEINQNIFDLIKELNKDTLVIVTADHGQIDVEEIELWKYPEVTNTFLHKPSIEARATAFFIQKGREKEFEEKFNENFREYYILYKSEDFIKTKLLGDDVEHPKLREFLGDYFAIAIDKYSFKLINSKKVFKGQHAGLTKDEMLIPLIMFSKK